MCKGLNRMDDTLIFRIDATYLTESGDKLCKLIDDWNANNDCETFTTTFIIEEDLGEIIVDYSFNKENKDRIEKLTKQILDRFNVKYELI